MADEKKKEEIAKAGHQALAAAPDYLKDDDKEGLETITRQDMLIPRLSLAQALSPQVTEGDPNLIPGLKVGDLFNSITKQNYGGRVEFQVVLKAKPRAMMFRPIEDGGGVLDPNVPLGSDLLKWGNSGDKKADKPKATLFLDFIVRLMPDGEIIALSFKSSGIKVVKALNGLIVFRNKSIYAGKYVLTTGTELKPKPHRVYLVDNADWVTAEHLAEGKKYYEALKNIDLVTAIDRAPGDEPGDTDFDPAELEAQSHAAASGNVGKM